VTASVYGGVEADDIRTSFLENFASVGASHLYSYLLVASLDRVGTSEGTVEVCPSYLGGNATSAA